MMVVTIIKKNVINNVAARDTIYKIVQTGLYRTSKQHNVEVLLAKIKAPYKGSGFKHANGAQTTR